MTTIFHQRLYGRFLEIQSNLRRKKLHKVNQNSNFPGGSFGNRDNVKAPIQFIRERQPQHFKRWFFLKNRLVHFHINNTSVIGPVKQSKLSFCSIEINKPLPAQVHRVFQTMVRSGGEGTRNFTGWGIFLLGSGNLRSSDFDQWNLFQS